MPLASTIVTRAVADVSWPLRLRVPDTVSDLIESTFAAAVGVALGVGTRVLVAVGATVVFVGVGGAVVCVGVAAFAVGDGVAVGVLFAATVPRLIALCR